MKRDMISTLIYIYLFIMKYSDICLRKHALFSIYRNTVQCGRCFRGTGDRFMKTELRRERKSQKTDGKADVRKGNRDEGEWAVNHGRE